jgi:hypothetical protein
MSPEDEVTWKQVGLFDKADDLGSGPLIHPHLLVKQTFLLKNWSLFILTSAQYKNFLY